jgi:hypothetical protein
LEIKYIKTENEFIYSYQVFQKSPIVRWDNAPHYPKLNNYPHHFHYKDKVEKSNLQGDLIKDLKEVLEAIPDYL